MNELFRLLRREEDAIRDSGVEPEEEVVVVVLE